MTTELVTEDIEVSQANIVDATKEIATLQIPETTLLREHSKNVLYWTDECTQHVSMRTRVDRKPMLKHFFLDSYI